MAGPDAFHVHNSTASARPFPCTTSAHSVQLQCRCGALGHSGKREYVDPVTGWTGRTACALQAALRLSNEAFAEHLGIGVRTVASWHQRPALRPRPEMQQVLDRALEQASPAIKARFAVLAGYSVPRTEAEPREDGAAADAELRLSTDPNIGSALDRLDQYAGWEPGTSWRQVASRLARLDVLDLQDRAGSRRRVGQRRIAEALGDYYRGPSSGHGRYGARYGNASEIVTSVLTHPSWLDLACPLTAACDRLTLTSASDTGLSLDEQAAGAAAQRLAETLATGTRLVDMPLFRLLAIDVGSGVIAGSVGVTQFVRYALTMDLLEGELIDALTAGVSPRPGSLPLRDRYLPDLGSVLGVVGRLCAGGTLALCAIARAASPYRGPEDYVLLIQERSGDVVNAARRLAVTPKGFHQPMTDFRADARIGATLRREMEEELFGREDTDNTVTKPYAADPMHPTRLSEPMRWLTGDPGRLKTECTGFGLNLVSGNFEFPGLIVIDTEDFWSRYGGQIEANWESASLRQYSSLDSDSLAELVNDAAWSNEGLFALLQGLRRLKQIGGDRVNVPAIEWQIVP
jgi:hypothetical protein